MALAVALAWLVGVAFPTEARAQMGSDSKVSVKAVPARTAARPGDRFPLAVVMEIAPEWHVWTSESQAQALPTGMVTFDSAIYTAIAAKEGSASAGMLALGAIQWPAPHGVEFDVGDGPQNFAVYEGKAIAYVPVSVPADATGARGKASKRSK